MPDSGGQALPDSTWQAKAMVQSFSTLHQLCSDRSDALVCVDLLVRYEPDTLLRVAPDVLVASGVPAGHRRTYKLGEEGKPPDFVLEALSSKTIQRDRTGKRKIHPGPVVPEFRLFDPMGGLMQPCLRGYRLDGNQYCELPRLFHPDGRLAARIPVPEPELQVVGESLRIGVREPRPPWRRSGK